MAAAIATLVADGGFTDAGEPIQTEMAMILDHCARTECLAELLDIEPAQTVKTLIVEGDDGPVAASRLSYSTPGRPQRPWAVAFRRMSPILKRVSGHFPHPVEHTCFRVLNRGRYEATVSGAG